MDPLGYGGTLTYFRFCYTSLCMLLLIKTSQTVVITSRREYFAYIAQLTREG